MIVSQDYPKWSPTFFTHAKGIGGDSSQQDQPERNFKDLTEKKKSRIALQALKGDILSQMISSRDIEKTIHAPTLPSKQILNIR